MSIGSSFFCMLDIFRVARMHCYERSKIPVLNRISSFFSFLLP